MSSPSERARTLGELQRWFHGRVIGPNLRGEAPATANLVRAAASEAAEQIVLPSATLTADERVAIYSGMYLLRIVGALAEDYPTVRALLGEEQFEAMIRAYVAQYPSRSYTLDHTGNELPEYLVRCSELDNHLLLADVARLERAINRSSHAPESQILASNAIAPVPMERWPALRFRLSWSAEVLAFDFPANDLVSAVHDDEPLPDVGRRPAWTLVWRKDFVVWRQALSEPRYQLLRALAAGATMEGAIGAAQRAWAGADEQLEAELFEWFADWLGEGIFAGVVLPSEQLMA
ncbi:MAG: putative DNA-binding domain-containing protein [Deltaproteobacteria bacterium]|jgi:hypothetical protein|nr:putative DNA-binding domain-containing protein [Deltaproteobacteria bacterium]MBW2530745.1 putative DNA-binding domain-containing protein [Deltaproteobacteria bacterium]